MHHDVHYRQSRRRPGCFSIFVVLCLLIVVAVWYFKPDDTPFLEALTPSRSGPTAGVDEFPPLTEIWAEGSGTNKVIRIPLTGVIMRGNTGGWFPSVSPAESALQSIRRATHDPDVRAIIMDIDSGGGGITACDIIYHALISFRQSAEGRRVITLCGDLAASGAYYIALASDAIMAHPTTVTGSIGVMIQGINVHEMAHRFGIESVTFASGENKDLLNPLEAVSPASRELLQTLVDSMHQRFVDLVAKHRPVNPELLDTLCDGRILTAEQAFEAGLIDAIGYWEDTRALTMELLGVDRIAVYRYTQSFSLRSWLQAFSQPLPQNLLGIQERRLQYRFTY